MPSTRQILMTALALLVAAGAALPAAAEPTPSSDLLLPWFEVHLSSQRTTLFSIGNAADEAVDVKAAVHTNWGIPVVERTIRLQAGEVKTVNLRDWIVAGNVPDPVLRGVHRKHVQAALTGQLSPKDDLFYATQADPFDPELAVGYVTLRVQSSPRLDALWGDYFWVDPEQDFAEGELLVDIDRSSACGSLCSTHRTRFMNGGGFDGGTKLVVWSPRRVEPAPNANAAFARLLALSPFHEEPGAQFDERVLELLPVQLVDVRELFLERDFGWMDLKTDEEIYVGVRYSASNRYSVTLQSWCIPKPPEPPGPPGDPAEPAITLEKSTNGEDADLPPGPSVKDATEGEVPGTVTWEYVVTNTGDVALSDVAVTDDKEGAIECPKSSLEAGEAMTCTKTGTAPLQANAAFFYDNLGTVVGRAPSGVQVTDEDPSHYQVLPKTVTPASIDIEKATNGHDADAAPGPSIQQGNAVTWTYVVTNTGQVRLNGVAVSDDREGAISCPKSSLQPGESMTCTETGTAQLGQYANVGSVTGTPQGGGSPVTDSDPSHYFGEEEPEPCGVCEGKVTRLTLRYLGNIAGAHVQVIAKRGPSNDVAFDGIVSPGGTFEVVGPAGGGGGFAGNLGTEIRIKVNGIDNATMHTSCSQPIGPGLVSGDFLVLEGASSGGGLLCPLN